MSACPRCGYHAVRDTDRQQDSDQITMLCQVCGNPFHARTILALCPACATVAETNHVTGEASGT